MLKQLSCLCCALLLLLCPSSRAQEKPALRLVDWKPVSQLVVPQTHILRPRFPVVDIHNHLGNLDKAAHYLSEMDKVGVVMAVSLDGHSKDHFYKQHLERSKAASESRFLVFFAPEWSRIDEPDFGRNEAKRLEEAVALGARGVKVYKSLGLSVKDKSGKFLAVDDPRLDPIWAKCGELGIPVLMHVSDPKAFFTPLDEHNERYDELGQHPDWSFYGNGFPTKEALLEQRNRVLKRHPGTVFIGAHMANLPEDLGQVAIWLDTYPNLYVEISARISELGRQPVTCRKFMIRYQDRVLFGTDTAPDAEAYRIYFRFLETADEYIDPAQGHHLQGRWMIYGLDLPDDALEKIYHKNALRILGMKKGGSR